jgi:hypothetical protein
MHFYLHVGMNEKQASASAFRHRYVKYVICAQNVDCKFFQSMTTVYRLRLTFFASREWRREWCKHILLDRGYFAYACL